MVSCWWSTFGKANNECKVGLKFTQKLINCSDFNHYSERLIKQQADRLAEDGYKDAGYEYVSIDVSVAIFYY